MTVGIIIPGVLPHGPLAGCERLETTTLESADQKGPACVTREPRPTLA
jgi:hypothetical protein